MRLHAVIVPPAEAFAEFGQAVDSAGGDEPAVPWLPRHEWQLRLAYFGNLGLRESVTIRETLTKIGSYCHPLMLQMVGAEALPEEGRAETLTVGLAGDVDALWSLARAIPSMVQPYGLFLDRRSFRASITIAQGSRGPFDARQATSRLAGFSGIGWQADEMRIVRWVPGGAGGPDDWETVDSYRFTAPREDTDAPVPDPAAH